jgi:hypothetical protein
MTAREKAWSNCATYIRRLCTVEHTGPLHTDLCELFARFDALRDQVGDWEANPGADAEAALRLADTEGNLGLRGSRG